MTEVEIVRQLAANFLITMFFIGVWAALGSEATRLKGYARAASAGLFMGLAAIISLLYTVDLGGGYLADLRAVPVAVAGLFAGPLAGIIAVAVTAGARLWMGGAGAAAGILTIALSGCVGLAG